MENRSVFEIVSFIASVASLILAIVAIWLSIVFYKLSNNASKATTEAAKGIEASVERLEKLFDKLYSDTFSMMRDTVSDMRKHMWPTDSDEEDKIAEETEKKSEQKINELKELMDNQLQEIFMRQRLTEEKTVSLTQEMKSLLDKAMIASRQVEVEVREETLREQILRSIRMFQRTRPRVNIENVIEKLRSNFSMQQIIGELENLKSERRIELSPDEIQPGTAVRILNTSERRPEGFGRRP